MAEFVFSEADDKLWKSCAEILFLIGSSANTDQNFCLSQNLVCKSTYNWKLKMFHGNCKL